MAKRTYGCSTIINAVNLQFELAGHGLYTDLKRAQGGMWLAEHTIKRPEALPLRRCSCGQLVQCHCGPDSVKQRKGLYTLEGACKAYGWGVVQ